MNNPLGNNFFNSENVKRFEEEMKRQNNKTLQHKFSGRVKGNFLISMKEQIARKLGNDVYKYYDLQIKYENVIDNSYVFVDYDICQHLVGIHRSNLIFEKTETRKRYESSCEYQDMLVDKALKQIRLRGYGSIHLRQHPILRGESFIFFPVPYYLFVLCMRMLELLYPEKAKKDLRCYGLFSAIVNKGLAALSLLESNFLDNAYPLCRGVIEMYIKLLIMMNNPEAISEYNKFLRYELEKTCTSQTYCDEFNNKYSSRKHQGSKDKIDYLHYGWVDAINDYHYFVKGKPYSFDGLINYLHSLHNEEDNFSLDNLVRLFKMCHGSTHGNVGCSIYPLLHYFEISMMLYQTLSHTYEMICALLNQDTQINDVDVLAELTEAYATLEQQYANRSTKNFEYYYHNQYKI